jgi:hypothetical protein
VNEDETLFLHGQGAARQKMRRTTVGRKFKTVWNFVWKLATIPI